MKSAGYRIGIDGGATKTECILVDEAGVIVARHTGPGCNPNVAGPDEARLVVTEAIRQLRQSGNNRAVPISHTHLYAAGNRDYWRQVAATLTDCGEVFTADDSHPVLELATHGRPGLVLHSGTGSFVAVRGPDGVVHYAGGLGWRLGDPGSGYDIGRRAIARAVMELQGWQPPSQLVPEVRAHLRLGAGADAAVLTRHCYASADANREIATLAPVVLRLAAEGDEAACQLVLESAGELLTLATRVAGQLFGEDSIEALPAGLSGSILTHPMVAAALNARSRFPLVPVEGAPIEGVRRLLTRA